MASTLLLPTLPLTVPYLPMRMSVERYQEMILSGFIQEDDRIELLDGVLVQKMTKNPRHSVATKKGENSLIAMLTAQWHVRNQEPLVLSSSVPEPDLAVVRGPFEDYGNRHPTGGDVSLVIEVADSSLVTDRYKALLYSHAMIPNYWIINLNERTVEVYTLLAGGAASGYGEPRVYQEADSIPVAVEGCRSDSILVVELLP